MSKQEVKTMVRCPECHGTKLQQRPGSQEYECLAPHCRATFNRGDTPNINGQFPTVAQSVLHVPAGTWPVEQ